MSSKGTITEHFSYREFEKTSYEEFKYKNVISNFGVRNNIYDLTVTILEPLRQAWGGAIRITSGYRCPELNAKVGGSKTSAHLAGLAADLQPIDAPVEGFIDFAVRWILESGVPFDQMIREKSGSTQWLHIGLRNLDGAQRKQILTINKKNQEK